MHHPIAIGKIKIGNPPPILVGKIRTPPPVQSFDGKGSQTGISATSETGTGVSGSSTGSSSSGIFGINNDTTRVPKGLQVPGGNGVWGHTRVPNASGVCGSVEPGLTREAAGVTGIGPVAGRFFGDVEVSNQIHVSGDINVSGHIHAENSTVYCYDANLSGGDCAEDFDVSEAESIVPGTVMVLDQQGALEPSCRSYDKKVAGIISGAGDYKPGIVLDKRKSDNKRMPLALMGKVYCRVDANYGPIEVGDLLTTSSTPGCAMKAEDPQKAFGAVIGKALRPLRAGLGLIPVLVALQ